jgi:hypothetical protein
VVDRHGEIGDREEVLALEVVADELLGGASEVRAVVRHVDGEESHGEDGLALGEGRLTLVEASGGHDLAKGGCEAVKSLGRAGNDVHGRAVVEGHAELGVGRKVCVDLFQVTLELLDGEAADREHGSRDTLVVLHRVGNDVGLDGKEREGLLAAETDVEEELDGLEDVGLER